MFHRMMRVPLSRIPKPGGEADDLSTIRILTRILRPPTIEPAIKPKVQPFDLARTDLQVKATPAVFSGMCLFIAAEPEMPATTPARSVVP
jgi:hypothetical protein